KEGDIIGLDDKKIVAKGNAVNEVVKHTIEKVKAEDACVISLYYGSDVSELEATTLAEELQVLYPDFEILTYFGGQPHYFYIFSIE
ncbi:MAG: DAK2 domain-containing protein, partial [Clostridia bacterium]